MKKYLFIITAIIVIAAVYFIWDNHKKSPEYTIKQISQSISEKQRLKFEQYVDVDNICKEIVDGFINQTMMETIGNSEDGWVALGSALGNKLIDNIKPSFKSLLKSSVVESIQNGSFDELFEKSDMELELYLSEIKNVFEINPNDISNYKYEVNNDFGILSLENRSDILDTALNISFKFEKKEDYWRITGFDNLESYLRTLGELKEDKLWDINHEIRKTLEEIIETKEYTASKREYGSYEVNLPVKNIGKDSINLLYINLRWIDDDEIITLIHAGEEKIAPNETVILTRNVSKYLHDEMFYNSLENGFLEKELILCEIFINGKYKSYREYEDWDEYKRGLDDTYSSYLGNSLLEIL